MSSVSGRAKRPKRSMGGARRARLVGLAGGGALAVGALFAPAALAAPAPPYAQCPAIGNDSTGCGLLIDIANDGSISIGDSGQGPYDGSDDTLIGVQNDSPIKVGSLTLTGTGLPPFAFDGDGLCSGSFSGTPGGCPFGPSGYEGPGVTYTNVSADQQTGTVNFNPPIPPGGSAYFSLENVINANNLVIPAPPKVNIITPANNATYPLNSTQDANYTCTDSDGTVLTGANCTGPVNVGQPINTSTSGQHCFTVTATSPDGESSQATNCYTVALPTTKVTITGSGPNGNSFTSDYDDPGTVSATLTDTSNSPATPESGKSVTFKLNGSESCSGTTDSKGNVSCSITPGEVAGTYPLVVSFAGDTSAQGSSATGSYVVTKEETTLSIDGPGKVANGQPATLSGTLKEDGTSGIVGRSVTFTLGTGASAQTCSGTTVAGGHASCTIASVNQPAPLTSVALADSFAGDGNYKPASNTGTASLLYYTGRAYDASVTLPLLGSIVLGDTGAIQTSQAGTVSKSGLNLPLGVAALGLLNSGNSITTGNGTSSSSANIGTESAALSLLPVINASQITATSTSTCSSASGSTSIASLVIGGQTVIGPGGLLPSGPQKTQTLSVLGLTIIINGQTPVAGASKGLTVNAIEIKAPLGLLDLVLGSAESDIHNC